jgi:hypothetical protein
VLALLAEFNMKPGESHLQSLATLRKPTRKTTVAAEKEESLESPIFKLPHRQRTNTKILHFRITSNK